jgi:hypothetical protein
VAQARLDGRSHGFYVIDDIGSEYTRDGNAVKFTNFVNRYVSSREDKRIHKPYFTLWLEDGAVESPKVVSEVKTAAAATLPEFRPMEVVKPNLPERRFRPRTGFDALFCREGRNDRFFGRGQTTRQSARFGREALSNAESGWVHRSAGFG